MQSEPSVVFDDGETGVGRPSHKTDPHSLQTKWCRLPEQWPEISQRHTHLDHTFSIYCTV